MNSEFLTNLDPDFTEVIPGDYVPRAAQGCSIAPIIIAALISAAAAAAGGIAGAAGQGEAAKNAANMSAEQRRQQEKIVKMQLAQQQAQFDQTQAMQGQQAVGSAIQNQANTALDRAAERQKSRTGLLQALSRLMG